MSDHSTDDESSKFAHKGYFPPRKGPDKLARAPSLDATVSAARHGSESPLAPGEYSRTGFATHNPQLSHLDAARALSMLRSAAPSRSATPFGPPETAYTDTEDEYSGTEDLTREWGKRPREVDEDGEEEVEADEEVLYEDDSDGGLILSLDDLDTTYSRFHTQNSAQVATASSAPDAKPFPANRHQLVEYLNLGLSPINIFPSEGLAVHGEVTCKATLVLVGAGWKQTGKVCGVKLSSNDNYTRHIKTVHLGYTRKAGGSLQISKIVKSWGYEYTCQKVNLALKLQDCPFTHELQVASPDEIRPPKLSSKKEKNYELPPGGKRRRK